MRWALLLLPLLLLAHEAQAETFLDDINALKAIRDQSHTLLAQWDEDTDPCDAQWSGVTCCEDGSAFFRVCEIELDNISIINLPVNLALVTQLTKLSLSKCNLQGTIDELSFSAMTNLNQVVISKNFLEGSLPPTLFESESIEIIDLSHNNLSGELPTTLGSSPNLDMLHLHYNSLTGSIPETIGQLTKLRELMLQGNQLSGSLPASTPSLLQLEILDVSHNDLSGELPATIGVIPLRRALMQHNGFTGELPVSVTSFTNLEEINLSNNNFTGTGLASLLTLPFLEIAVVGDNQFSCPVATGWIDQFGDQVVNVQSLCERDCVAGKESNALDSEGSGCTECVVGSFKATGGTHRCSTCPPGSVSKTAGSSECEKCPIGASCDGDNTQSQPAYYLIGGIPFICRYTTYCEGGNACRTHHVGPLCDVCEPDTDKWVTFACDTCPNQTEQIAYGVIHGMTFIVHIALFSTLLSLAKENKGESLRTARILFSFLQATWMIGKMITAWPDEVYNVFFAIETVASPRYYPSLPCLGELIFPDARPFHFRVASYMSMPVVYAVVLGLIVLVMVSYKAAVKDKKKLGERAVTLWTRYFVLLYLFCYPAVYYHTLAAMSARELHDADVVEFDMSLHREDETHQNIMLGMAVPSLLLFCIGIPALLFRAVRRIGIVGRTMASLMRYGILFKGCKPKFFYWEIAIMLKVFLLSILLTILAKEGAVVQCAAYMAMTFLGAMGQILFSPYRTNHLNQIESLCLAHECVLVWCGLIFSLDTCDDVTFNFCVTNDGKRFLTLVSIGSVVVPMFFGFGYLFVALRTEKRLQWLISRVGFLQEGVVHLKFFKKKAASSSSSDNSSDNGSSDDDDDSEGDRRKLRKKGRSFTSDDSESIGSDVDDDFSRRQTLVMSNGMPPPGPEPSFGVDSPKTPKTPKSYFSKKSEYSALTMNTEKTQKRIAADKSLSKIGTPASVNFQQGDRVVVKAAEAPFAIGRSRLSDLVLNYFQVSGNHCRFTYEDGIYSVEDLGSTNGTVLNKLPLQPKIPQPLSVGDKIEVPTISAGKAVFLVSETNDKQMDLDQVLYH